MDVISRARFASHISDRQVALCWMRIINESASIILFFTYYTSVAVQQTTLYLSFWCTLFHFIHQTNCHAASSWGIGTGTCIRTITIDEFKKKPMFTACLRVERAGFYCLQLLAVAYVTTLALTLDRSPHCYILILRHAQPWVECDAIVLHQFYIGGTQCVPIRGL